jgi:hypothetical protein
MVAVIIAIVIILAGVGGYYAYTNSQQPNIQATNIQIAQPQQSPQSSVVVDQGQVPNGASFNYITDLPGSYVMVFDNSFSILSSKSVSLSFSTGGSVNQQSFQVPAGQTKSVSVALLHGQLLNGSFQVSGGSGNDIDFYIQGNTCSQTVSFTFTLVNVGNANGLASVGFQSDGSQPWANRYFVAQGQQSAESGSAIIQDCNSHVYSVVVAQQQKA